MNRYEEMRNRQQEEFNAFPMGAAFSDTQFAVMMQKWGLDKDKDLDKICRLPFNGCFCRKSDVPQYKEMMKRHDAEMKAAIEADKDGTGFIYEMFLYELDNHEYGYTGDLEDTLYALDYTMEEINADERLRLGLYLAAQKIYEREM